MVLPPCRTTVSVFTPSGMAAIKSTVESPEFKEACLRLGARPAFLPADAFGRQIALIMAGRKSGVALFNSVTRGEWIAS